MDQVKDQIGYLLTDFPGYDEGVFSFDPPEEKKEQISRYLDNPLVVQVSLIFEGQSEPCEKCFLAISPRQTDQELQLSNIGTDSRRMRIGVELLLTGKITYTDIGAFHEISPPKPLDLWMSEGKISEEEVDRRSMLYWDRKLILGEEIEA